MPQRNTQADTSLVNPKGSNNKSIDLLTCTIRSPPFSYVHLTLASGDPTTLISNSDSQTPALDELQLKSYCTAACRQFLGLTGAAIPIDILKVEGVHGWVRVPREDLSRFSAAITTWKGTIDGDAGRVVLRVKQCSDWLGMMVGTADQDKLWGA